MRSLLGDAGPSDRVAAWGHLAVDVNGFAVEVIRRRGRIARTFQGAKATRIAVRYHRSLNLIRTRSVVAAVLAMRPSLFTTAALRNRKHGVKSHDCREGNNVRC